MQQKLLDHLVCELLKLQRHSSIKRLCRLEIDHELADSIGLRLGLSVQSLYGRRTERSTRDNGQHELIASALPRAFHSLDYLIGTREQRRWDGDAECLRYLEINSQMKFGRLHHRQICRFLALENSAGIYRRLKV
jgi:hypothetical protein